MANDRGVLQQISGNCGKDPENFESSKGPGTRFSVARPMGYGDDAPPPRWIDVAVWNEEIRAQVMAQVRKGTRVYVEGTITESEYQGKPQYRMNAARVGLVAFFTKTKPYQPRQDAPPAKAEPEEELGW